MAREVDVIAALPEIVPAKMVFRSCIKGRECRIILCDMLQHPKVAEHLQPMLDERKPLVHSLVDCYG